ncbi:hypothetical protein JTB14_029724 [Gonioctena quinquepunctata]|nr:hypothetical protein JTB14_029724 [Gonioctena quinquepunctata]
MSKDEENMLANAIGVAADWGYPCDSNDIKDIVQKYLGRHGRTAPQFVNNRPGETWLQKFLLQHKEKLSKRLSQSMKESRAKVCHETVNKYFDNLAESLKDVPPSAVVNYDETNFTDDPGRVKGSGEERCLPRLLNQASNHVEASGEKNIKSGFEATGICPLNRKKVLDKLPKTDEPALPGDMAQSLKEIFESSRFKTAVTVGRKKKLTVPAGRSISRHDVEMPQTSSGKKTIAKSKNKQTRSLSSASSESAISEKLLTVHSDAN